MSDDSTVKEIFLEEVDGRRKSRKTKIKMVGLY
jgi:hypothetical protein